MSQTFLLLSVILPAISASAAVCAFSGAVSTTAHFHVNAWQSEAAKIPTADCAGVFGFLYSAHSQVLKGLDELVKGMEEGEESMKSTASALNALGSASSLLSAQAFGIGEIAATRQGCLTPTIRTMAMVSVRHLRQIREAELKSLWFGYQGSPETFRLNVLGFLRSAHGIFQLDQEALRTAITGQYNPPVSHLARMNIQDAMKAETFPNSEPFRGEAAWKAAVLRGVVAAGFARKGDTLVDLSAGFGRSAVQESDLFVFHAFDTIPEISVASSGRVQQLPEALPRRPAVVLAIGAFSGTPLESQGEVLERIESSHPGMVVVDDLEVTWVYGFVKDEDASERLRVVIQRFEDDEVHARLGSLRVLRMGSEGAVARGRSVATSRRYR